jgi:hypothetical protein
MSAFRQSFSPFGKLRANGWLYRFFYVAMFRSGRLRLILPPTIMNQASK